MMAHILDRLLRAVVPTIMAQNSGTDLVSSLLTGGGFVFLATIVTGLIMWNKNQSESIASIGKASQEFVAGARAEVAAARKDAAEARKDAEEARKDAAQARDDLEESQEKAEEERRKFRRWIRRQKAANDEHKLWDDELKAAVEQLGGIIRDAPPLSTCSTDDPDHYPPR